MKNICVFCGSNPGARPEYLAAARELGNLLADQSIGLVFGGGNVGMMGETADAALEGGGKVIGVIPDFLREKELAHKGATEMIVVETMHERKMKMAELSDGFIALPGGWGTMDELCEILTWAQLGLHGKPVALYNVAGYFDELIQFFDKIVEERFLSTSNRQLLLSSSDLGQLVGMMRDFRAPDRKSWLDETQV